MPQIPLLSGIYADQAGDLRVSYPVNLAPQAQESGISDGYLRPADGIVAAGTGPGVGRGAIVWSGTLYRVMGSKLCRIAADGTVAVLGDVGDDGGPARLSYGFDRLAIVSAGGLYYWTGTLTRVTDTDLGGPRDVVWADGYYLTTDGSYLVVTELNDPTQVDPLKYGSVEADPDPVQCLLRLRTEVVAVGRYSTEWFQNVGGDGFPFQRVAGAQLTRGALGLRCACLFQERVVLLGGGRGEAPAIWWGVNGVTDALSTRQVEAILATYTEADLAAGASLEARMGESGDRLLVHLPRQTLVYDVAASADLKSPVWHVLSSSADGSGEGIYRARDLAWAYGRWWVADTASAAHGYLSPDVGEHWGEVVGWRVDTPLIYGDGRGVQVHRLELVTLAGRAALGADPVVWASHSTDGRTWSTERAKRAGGAGEAGKRLVWHQAGAFRHWRAQRFRGTSDARLSLLRLEAALERLYV